MGKICKIKQIRQIKYNMRCSLVTCKWVKFVKLDKLDKSNTIWDVVWWLANR